MHIMRWPYRDKRIEWNEKKNEQLIRARGVSFQDVMLAVEEDRLIDIIPHRSKKNPHQDAIIVNIREYTYVVPCVIGEETIFLKTIFASRKVMRKYL